MKRNVIFAISLIVMLSIIGIVFGFAESDSFAEIFKQSNDISVVENYALNINGINDSRNGLLLSTSKSGAVYSFNNEFTGNFEMDFRIFTDNAFNDSNAKATLREFSIEFVDHKTNEKISMDMQSNFDEIWIHDFPQIKMTYNGRSVGIYNALLAYGLGYGGNTSAANFVGHYTALAGTSFCNKSATVQRNGIGACVMVPYDVLYSNAISFCPSDMSFYAKCVNTATNQYCDQLIWRFTDDGMDGRYFGSKVAPFESYTVNLVFKTIDKDKTANLLIYSINGENVTTSNFPSNMAPSVFASIDKNAVVGEKYYIPSPKAYSCVKGNVNFEGEIKVYDSANNEVNIYVGDEITNKYSNGCYFKPYKSGEYRISYIAKSGTKQYVSNVSLKCLTKEDSATEFNFEYELGDRKVGVGTEMALPTCQVFSPEYILDNQRDAFYSVYKDGVIYNQLENIDATLPGTVRFAEAGQYVIKYFADGVQDFKSFNIVVTNDIPVFTYSSNIVHYLGVGEYYEAPSVTCKFNGVEKQPRAIIITPSGASYEFNSKFFNESGIYKIIYSVEYDGTVYSDYHTIAVDIDKSSLFSGNIIVEENAFNTSYPEFKGVLITPKTNYERFKYNQIIDLSQSDVETDGVIDRNATPLIDISYVTRFKEAIVGSLTITLTDIHDKNNYVTIYAHISWDADDMCYCSASANGQPLLGNYWGNVIDGQQYGAPCSLSFKGRSGMYYTYDTFNHRVWYDADDKKVYCQIMKGGIWEVVDLDADYQTSKFKGFTTGEVQMTVEIGAPAVISEINGIKLYGNQNDYVAPTIHINNEGELPFAIVGIPFPVFSASVVDNVSQNCGYSVMVAKNYGTHNEMAVSVTDGKFVPDGEGVYTLIYTAKDGFGNVATKTVDIIASNSQGGFVAQLSQNLNGNQYCIGDTIKLPKVSNVTGASGDVQTKIMVIAPNRSIVYMEQGDTIKLDQIGSYTISYIITDYLGFSQIIQMAVTSNMSDTPVILGVEHPEIIMDGGKFVFPQIKAIDYSQDLQGEELDVEISVKINGSTQVLPLGTKDFTPHISSRNDTMEITYKAVSTHTGKSQELTYSITVVKPNVSGAFDELSYFYDANNDFSSSAENEYLSFTTSNNGAKLTFINKLSPESINFRFFVPQNRSNYSSIKVLLTQANDFGNSVEVLFTKGSSNEVYVSINGGKAKRATGSFASPESYISAIGFYYNNYTHCIFDTAGTNCGQIYYTADGKEFNGFSDDIYVSFELDDVQGTSTINFVRIGNVLQLSNVDDDYIGPSITLKTDAVYSVKMGQTVILPAAKASDVFDCNSSVTVSVLLDKKIVLSNASAEIANVITANEYGIYKVTYTATDTNGNATKLSYNVSVEDNVPPTITVDGKLPSSAKIGDTVAIPTATASDDVSTNLIVKVYVITPSYNIHKIADGKFTVEYSGTYIVRYYVTDASGNYAYKDYYFNVNKGE